MNGGVHAEEGVPGEGVPEDEAATREMVQLTPLPTITTSQPTQSDQAVRKTIAEESPQRQIEELKRLLQQEREERAKVVTALQQRVELAEAGLASQQLQQRQLAHNISSLTATLSTLALGTPSSPRGGERTMGREPTVPALLLTASDEEHPLERADAGADVSERMALAAPAEPGSPGLQRFRRAAHNVMHGLDGLMVGMRIEVGGQPCTFVGVETGKELTRRLRATRCELPMRARVSCQGRPGTYIGVHRKKLGSAMHQIQFDGADKVSSIKLKDSDWSSIELSDQHMVRFDDGKRESLQIVLLDAQANGNAAVGWTVLADQVPTHMHTMFDK